MSIRRAFVYTGAIILGMPFAIVGIGLCFLLVTIPVGILLILISGLPLKMAVKHYTKQDVQDANQAKLDATHAEGPAPWFDED
jgi:hypothetical protein